MSEDKKVIFSMNGVTKRTPQGKEIIRDIQLSFYYGAKIGIIGLNGAGKSTLLHIIAGNDDAYEGDVHFSSGYSVGMLEQEPDLDPEKTTKEVVQEGVQETVDLLNEYEKVNEQFTDPDVMADPERMNKLIEQQGKLQEQIDHVDAWELDSKLERAMDALRCPPDDRKVQQMSGGEKRRTALCRLLLSQPDILLLDEPTNHLDAESVNWLEQHLQQYHGTVIAITHDRYFLDNAAGWILELDRGEGIPWRGNYSSWLEQKQKRLEQEEKEESKRQKTLQRELEWAKMTPKGRQTKAKARLKNYKQLQQQEKKEKAEQVQIYVPDGPRLGDEVIEAQSVTKAFDDKVLIEDLSFKLPPAGIVGVVGPNGAGKSTLFRMITGREEPDKGNFKVGDTVELGYVDQEHEDVDPDSNVWQAISGGEETIEVEGRSFNSRAYVARFNFTGPDQSKKVKDLSGGERNRLHLALTLKQEANVLLLDEPTNDIDVNTLQALEEGLDNFAGCAVVISHDRWFLDRICTHILAFEGEGHVHFFQGSFSEYEENRQKRLGEEIPQRIKHKKLVKDQ